MTSQKLSNQDTFGPNGSTDTLMVAPVTSDFASVMDASMSPDAWLPCPALTTSTLDFQLRNRYYDVLQNVPNISFVLTLR